VIRRDRWCGLLALAPWMVSGARDKGNRASENQKEDCYYHLLLKNEIIYLFIFNYQS
jgi:hypothetical protein